MPEVTRWMRWDERIEAFRHNHVADREPPEKDTPTPVSEVQGHLWSGVKWSREDGWLNDKNEFVPIPTIHTSSKL